MQIHQHIPYGLLYSVEPLELAKFHLSEHTIQDDFVRDERDDEHVEELPSVM